MLQFGWLEITRYRRPHTPLHTWRLERKYATKDEPYHSDLEAQWGWYQEELTSQAVAIACHKYRRDVHYDVRHGRVKWTAVGERAGVAPNDSQRILERIEEWTQMLEQERPLYRLQVRKENWSLEGGEYVDRWGYRIVDATGRVEDAASSSYCELFQSDRER